MNLVEIVESITVAVAGALLLSVIYWLVNRVKSTTPLTWFVVSEHKSKFERNGRDTTVGFCVIIIRNKTRSIVGDVKMYFNGDIAEIISPDKYQASVLPEDPKIISIPHIQAKEDLILTVRCDESFFVHPKRLSVAGADQGRQALPKVVVDGAVIIPQPLGNILISLVTTLAWALFVFGIVSIMD
ncbi:MAG: hypothetical protein IOD05_20320 [Rhodobacter sp.]|nr:hypothetical protein [Rhodobacter sp.]MCA3492753.1 hypothetical protein [Rhodobacter sp.]MCA3501112.1 hypothetical protein [Rhodobacter sp.]MCA3505552.1 hypothetical protein [Rhodobacter sp.]MCA3518414.1 hypothetical protein [Rhodobacter sp.]